MTSYDEVAYPSVPLAQTQPDGFATQAHLHGVRAPDPTRCRVLEIGCSDAGNLAWLAAHTPGSWFLGVALSQAAVGQAQGVIAHGVYSWLPRPGDLLACIDRHLADDGIAYVSYNVMPGSRVRQMAGDVIRRHTAGMPDRVTAARALMDLVRSATVASPHAQMMREAMLLSSEKPDHLLIHDEMAEFNYAPYFDEFVADAASHQLAYLGETHQADSDPPGVTLPRTPPTARWPASSCWTTSATGRSARPCWSAPATPRRTTGSTPPVWKDCTPPHRSSVGLSTPPRSPGTVTRASHLRRIRPAGSELIRR